MRFINLLLPGFGRIERVFISNFMILSLRKDRINITVYKSAFYLVLRG